MKKVKLGRFILLILILSIVVIPFAKGKAVVRNKYQYAKVTVYSGDTLWKIASEYNTDNSDVRKLIYKIREINKLDTAVITPGQELLIPVN